MGAKITSGISMGCVLAMILSFAKGNGIILIIIHGFFSWVYVIWWVLT